MKVVVFANRELGAHCVRVMAADTDTDIVGLVVHPDSRAIDREAVIEAAGLPADRVILAPTIRTPAGIERLRSWDADMGVSVLFAYILREPVLALFPEGVVNLHPALLPWNRGRYTNVWPIVEQTPAGATLHLMDAGIDTGPILAQQAVDIDATDTGETLSRRLVAASRVLFEEHWPAIASGRLAPCPQDPEAGTYHVKADADTIDCLDLDAVMSVRDVLNRLRARTFPPHEGCYFVDENGQRVFLRLELYRADEK